MHSAEQARRGPNADVAPTSFRNRSLSRSRLDAADLQLLSPVVSVTTWTPPGMGWTLAIRSDATSVARLNLTNRAGIETRFQVLQSIADRVALALDGGEMHELALRSQRRQLPD